MRPSHLAKSVASALLAGAWAEREMKERLALAFDLRGKKPAA